jgi:hypothetical protein
MTGFDDTLTRLFAEAREPLPTEEFLETVAIRVHHARRRRTLKQAVSTGVAAVLALLLTPRIVTASLAGATHLGVWLPALGNALTSPLGWAFSLALAARAMRRARHPS